MQASVAEAPGMSSDQMKPGSAYQPAMPDPVTLNPRYAGASNQSMTRAWIFHAGRQTGAIPSQQNSGAQRRPGQSPVPGFGMVDVKVAPGGATSEVK